MTKPMSTTRAGNRLAGIRHGRAVLPGVALALTLATPVLAQTTSPAAAPTAVPPTAAMQPAPAVPAPSTTATAAPAAEGPISPADLQTALGHDKATKIEAHIGTLRTDLKITPAQDAVWQAFAGTMRANAVQMDGAYGKRQQNYAGMNAVQDLQSYGEVEQTNARNIAQLLPPFQALYAALSPQQQKLADNIFVRHIDKAVKKPG